jgi:pumilio RNA-binding family
MLCAAVLEHGSERHKTMTVDHLVEGLLEFATHEQGSKSVTKSLKEGGKDTLNKIVKRMCEPAKGYADFYADPLRQFEWTSQRKTGHHCRLGIDRHRQPTHREYSSHCPRFYLFPGSVVSHVCLQADKDQRALLYECIRSHIVTLRGCKTGSKVIWLLCV